MRQIGIMGLGFMGSAIARAIRRRFPDLRIGVVEKDASRRASAVAELEAVDYNASPAKLVSSSEALVVAIKPQDLASFSETVGTVPPDRLLISVLAGTSIERVAEYTGSRRVVRIMPNLAAEVGRAVVGVSFTGDVGDEERKSTLDLLDGLGTLLEIPERLMAAITGLAGSGIAFAFDFVHALAMGGVEQGLAYPQSLTAALEVVESAAILIRHSGAHPQELISRVCSPAGTTVAGVRALAAGGLQETVMDAVGRAAARSRKLEG